MEHIRTGKLRALGVTSASRLDLLPEVAPISDFLPGYEVTNWYGIGAPRNTPREIVVKLNEAISASLDNPKIKERLTELGGTLLQGSPADFGKLIADETEKWSKVVKFAGLKPQ